MSSTPQPTSKPTPSPATPEIKPISPADVPPAALAFVQEGLCYTVKRIHGRRKDAGSRHVNGRQLCEGLRDFAISRYGLLARQVLAHWQVRRTDDFGRIIYALIQSGHMCSSDEDSFEHFQNVYSFDEAFDEQAIVERLVRN